MERATHQAHALERYVELFGDHLRDGNLQPLPAVDAPIEHGHDAVGVDREKRIELIGHQRRLRRRGGRRSVPWTASDKRNRERT